jgi:hypothetical protein
MRHRVITASIFLLFASALFSCKKPQHYSKTPAIKFQSLIMVDSIDALDNKIKNLALSFTFVDGDGDLGLGDGDTVAPYDTSSIHYYNLIIDTYRKENGQFQKMNLTVPLYYRFPDIQTHGQDKTIKGTLLANFRYYVDNQGGLFNYGDTLKYEFYIFDRALNQSNIESTPEIILTH